MTLEFASRSWRPALHPTPSESVKLLDPKSIASLLEASDENTKIYRCQRSDCPNPTPFSRSDGVAGLNNHDLYRCVDCKRDYCGDCWDKVDPHKSEQPDSTHAKEKPQLADHLNRILCIDKREPEEQINLHRQDAQSVWYGVKEDEHKQYEIHEGTVYNNLVVENASVQPWGVYPGLVTFVGDTGAGKSALIRLLLEIGVWAPENVPGLADVTRQLTPDIASFLDLPPAPIVGCRNDDTTPTSADVHLYADPKTLSTATARHGTMVMVYADCEGLNGGNQDPMAVKHGMKQGGEETDSAAQFMPYFEGTESFRPQKITWADGDRQVVVERLYPRALYSFSDVIVFVLENSKKFHKVVKTFVKWAHSAIESSCNQSVLPHAIIVMNKAETTGKKAWDPVATKSEFMESIQKELMRDKYLREKLEHWNSKGVKIANVEDLLKCYYASIQIIRVPRFKSPGHMEKQVSGLYDMIHKGCEDSQNARLDANMLLDALDFRRYLRHAFKHFATDCYEPFDFVKASFDINPISSELGLSSGVLRLACIVQKCSAFVGVDVWKEISPAIASCIHLRARLRDVKDCENPQSLFKEYWPRCEKAVEDFYKHHLACEFPKSEMDDQNKLHRCVNVRSKHRKGHQSGENGMILASNGVWECTHELGRFKEMIRERILYELNALSNEDRNRGLKKLQQVYKRHFATLRGLYGKLSKGASFNSNLTCLLCLSEAPEHALPCSHTICAACVEVAGDSLGSGYTRVTDCPLGCKIETYLASAKPAQAGVRVLTLDGGGIRGIVELTILQAIEKELGEQVPIQAFFDLMVGTSTGGIISLGLGHKGWSVATCIEKFKELAVHAFKKPSLPARMDLIPGSGLMARLVRLEKYDTLNFESTLKSAFSKEPLFGDTTKVKGVRTRTAVVTASPGGVVTVLANYNRKVPVEARYTFARAENKEQELQGWQSARATAAAPGYWNLFSPAASDQVYLDGGLYHNNPIRIADSEQKYLWPKRNHPTPDLLLSLGTGFGNMGQVIPVQSAHRGLSALARTVLSVGADLFKEQLACERMWEDWIETKAPKQEHIKRYRRMNVPLDHDPKMDVVGEIPMYERLTTEYLKKEETKKIIQDVARRLIASSFYYEFEKRDVSPNNDGTWECNGRIRCRFPPGEAISRRFGELLKSLCKASEKSQGKAMSIGIWVTETHIDSKDAKDQHAIDQNVISKMCEKGKFDMEPFPIKISSRAAKTNVGLATYVRGEVPYWFQSIGGFPRYLLKDHPDTDGKYEPTPKDSTRAPKTNWTHRIKGAAKRWKPNAKKISPPKTQPAESSSP